MSERKPPGVQWESWIDRQIRDGMERGDFDDLPGAGRPIADLDAPHDENWWVKRKLRREGVSVLPPTLAVRKELETTLAAINLAASEATVRRLVGGINARIVRVNRLATWGPPSTLVPLDVEDAVARWRAARLR